MSKLIFAIKCFLLGWRFYGQDIDVQPNEVFTALQAQVRDAGRFKVLVYHGPKTQPDKLYHGHRGAEARQCYERHMGKFWRVELWDHDVLRGDNR